ncbi:MAG: SGNH/GDSL hydrolase family protein [Verrucomicrobiales bacterium]
MNSHAFRFLTRRNALKLGFGGVATMSATGPALAASTRSNEPAPLAKRSTVLFQGDSITDSWRDRKDSRVNHPQALGRGYPLMIASELMLRHPNLNLKFYNRGVSGNKVPNLDARWDKDCLDLEPDVLSILIGVNDIWHKLNGKYDGTVKSYEEGFTALIERTQKALPRTRLVICQPFVLRCGAVSGKWFPEFTERMEAAKRVADKAKAIWVPFQDAFNEQLELGSSPKYWAEDGVHPSIAGHMLMAKTWLRAVLGEA